MLRVKMLSGEELTSVSAEDYSDVRSLKQHLHQFHGLPPRFRQRLFSQGEELDDSTKLDPFMDLELVLLTFCNASQAQADELTVAAHMGWVAEVESMLRLPQDPNLASTKGDVPLAVASLHGRVEVVRLLLEANADSNAASRDGTTALMTASYLGSAEIIRLLLEAGSNKDLVSSDGTTALLMASGRGHTEVVSLLLEARADKELGEDGVKAVMLAAGWGHVDVVRLLLKAGVDREDNCAQALLAASCAGHAEVLSLLLEGCTDKERACKTSLLAAAREGRVEVVRLLLASGTIKDFPYDFTAAALKLASVHGHDEVARLLREAAGGRQMPSAGGPAGVAPTRPVVAGCLAMLTSCTSCWQPLLSTTASRA